MKKIRTASSSRRPNPSLIFRLRTPKPEAHAYPGDVTVTRDFRPARWVSEPINADRAEQDCGDVPEAAVLLRGAPTGSCDDARFLRYLPRRYEAAEKACFDRDTTR